MLKRWLFLPFMGACVLVMLASQDRNSRLAACVFLLVLVQAREIMLMQELDFRLGDALAARQTADSRPQDNEKSDSKQAE